MADRDGDFKVVDKRKKSRDRDPAAEQPKSEAAAPAAEPQAATSAAEPAPPASAAGEPAAAEPAGAEPAAARTEDPAGEPHKLEMPPADFSTLIVSIATSSLLYLGDIPDPDGKQPVVNLDLARHTIDTLAMLQEKTRGNLTPPESALLERFLYDLRLRFVTRSGKR
jgi:hypothetical protein